MPYPVRPKAGMRGTELAAGLSNVLRPLAPKEVGVIDSRQPRVTFADLKITTKERELIPLVPNVTQTWYLDMLASDYAPFDWRGGNYKLQFVRDDILKSRQMGFSTIVMGLIFLDTINVPHTQSIIMTDNGDRSKMLFNIVHRFWDELPAEKKRKKKYSTKDQIEFEEIGRASGDDYLHPRDP